MVFGNGIIITDIHRLPICFQDFDLPPETDSRSYAATQGARMHSGKGLNMTSPRAGGVFDHRQNHPAWDPR